MFDQSYGLRFDIYERIHLSDDVAGIAELEEIELLPHIQVTSQDEQAALRGHLLLTGLYRSDDEEDGTQRLEHFIPVEITVPLNRVTSLDEIAVEIENFDVDLLSQRSLNITGVLSLRGIEVAAIEPAAWNADEFTVIHAPKEEEELPSVAFAEDAEAEQEELSEREELELAETLQTSAIPGISEASESVDIPEIPEFEEIQHNLDAYENERTNQALAAEAVAEEEPEVESGSPEYSFEQEERNAEPEPAVSAIETDKEADERSEEKSYSDVWHFEHEDEAELLHPEKVAIQGGTEDEADYTLNTVEREPFGQHAHPFGTIQHESVQPEDNAEEREKMRIALGSKKDAPSDSKEAIGFSSILASSRTMREQEQQAAEDEVQDQVQETEREAAGSEDIQWQNLFLGSSSEKTQFRKVRLCIVQREETLETIAERYQLSAREILLYNRLSEQTIEEGQVLYIP